MEFPVELKYSKDHEWIRDNGDGTVTVGITEFAQSELGELVFVEVESVGETIDKDEVFGTVEAVKTTSELFMPVSGEVIEFNSDIDENDGDEPGLINSDPYGAGWIIKIKMSDSNELKDLLDAKAYSGLVN